MLRKILLIVMFSFAAAAFAVPALAASVSGTVVDVADDKPIQGAEIHILGTGDVALTDARGGFRIGGLGPGTYQILAHAYGIKAASATLVVTGEDESLTVPFRLEQLPISFGEITVTGEPAGLLQSSELVSRDFEKYNPPDVGELLRVVPEMSAIRKGGFALDPSLRGLSGDRINVIMEGGVKVHGACPSRMDPATSHINATQLQRIEIIKGPFSVRYGPAFAGLINIATVRPEPVEEFTLRGRAGGGWESNADGKRADARFWGGAKIYDFLLGGGTRQYDDYKDGNGDPVASSFRVNDWTSKLGFNLDGGRQRLEAGFKGQYARDVLYPALPMDASLDDTFITSLDYSLRGSGSMFANLDLKAYFSRVDHAMDNFGKPTAAMMRSMTDTDSRTAGLRGETVFVLPAARTLTAGADYARENLDGFRTRDFLTGPMAGKHLRDIIWPDALLGDVGFFAEFHDPSVLKGEGIFGIRLDRLSSEAPEADPAFAAIYPGDLDRTDYTVNAFGSLAWYLKPGLRGEVALARAARSPSIPERYLFLLPVAQDPYDYLGNPFLDPEKNLEFDGGLRYENKRIVVGGSFFYSHLGDFISARIDPAVPPRSPGVLGVRRFVNIEKARRIGARAEVRVPIAAGVSVGTGATWMRGTDLERGEPLPQVPPPELDVVLSYEHPTRRFWGEVASRFVAPQDRVSLAFAEPATPGFGVVDLRGGFEVGRNRSIRLALENALNNNYYEHLNRLSKIDGRRISEPGRNFQFSFDVGF